MQFNVIQWLCHDKTELSWLAGWYISVIKCSVSKLKIQQKKIIKSNQIHIIQISHNNITITYDNTKPTDHLEISYQIESIIIIFISWNRINLTQSQKTNQLSMTI